MLLPMRTDWIPRALVLGVIALILGLFRRIAPPRSRLETRSYDQHQRPEPLPTGAIGAAMWALGFGFSLTFFLLRDANRLWGRAGGQSVLTLYPTPWIWFFLPLFSALAVPWPLTVWYLRKVGRNDEADSVADAADLRSGMDTFRVMKWLGIALIAPIAFFTLLAIPIHLSIGNSEARLGRYASFHTERFSFSEARRATLIDGYHLRNGSFHRRSDIVIDFADGRRLHGNAVGDGDTDVEESVVQLLLDKTGLLPAHVRSVEDIPSE
jgi:hypothetical protein